MPLILKDRVRESTTTTGTGAVTLAGAAIGFDSFSDIGDGNTTYYTIADDTAWEVGIGTYTASGTTLSRDTVLSNSLGTTALINFSAGTKDVFCTYPATQSVYKDATDKVTGYVIENSSIGATTPSTGKFTAVTTPSVSATTTDLTLSAISTGVVNVNTLNGTGIRLSELSGGAVNTGLGIYSGTASQNTVYATPLGSGTNSNILLASKGSGNLILGTGSNNGSVANEQMRVSHTASAVNYVQVTGSATGNRPAITAQGSDANAGLSLFAKGTGGVFIGSNLGTTAAIVSTPTTGTNYFAITGSATTVSPTISVAGGDTNIDLTLQTKGTGAINLNTGGGTQAKVIDATGANRFVQIQGGASGSSSPAVGTGGGGTSFILYSTGSPVNFFTNGYANTQQLSVAHTTSAVNYVQVTGGVTGGFVSISAQGSDSNPGIYYTTKGFGSHRFTTNGGGGSEQFRIITNSASTVNFLQVNGSATTLAPQFSAQGTDTNISMALQPKGTGAIDLAAGSSGVNISNGGTVTAITRTAAGGSYTSFPSVAISAPTTAGGVQATATVGSMLAGNTATIQAGGTGYTLNDTLTIVGGTPTASGATYTVTAVSGGVVTAVTALNFAQYTALPTNPVSVTGGTGSGCTLNVTYGVGTSPSFNITNAGSGYIEQPTVTFSGGGGSGAAATASVGSASIIRSLGGGDGGTSLSFFTPAGEALRIVNKNNTVNYLRVNGNSTGAGIDIAAKGTDANIPVNLSANGASRIDFFTAGDSFTRQFRVDHTASAVNYVQVTGGATGNGSTISVQGSDANAFLAITSKGTSAIRLQTNGSNQVLINNTTSAINQIGLTGSTAGIAPQISTLGTDTNIDLALTPKGTGRVKFGTYTGTILTPTGFIEIVDAGGTVRRLLVG